MLLLLCTGLLLPLRAQYQVFPVHVGDSLTENPGQGFFYSLPRNYFEVTVTVCKVSRYPGPFADYAERMLGLSGAIREPSIQYAVQQIAVNLRAEADTAQTYYVRFPKKTKPFPLEMPFAATVQGQVQLTNPNAQTQAQFEMYENYTLIEKTDTTYEKKLIDSEYVMVPKLHKRMVEKTTAQKAEEALAKIKSIREAQWLLLTGDHEVDFTNVEYMVSELKKEEETYVSLYSGFSVTETETLTFALRLPAGKEDEYRLPLFTFSPSEGVCKGRVSKPDAEVYSLHLTNSHTTDAAAQLLQQASQYRKKRQGGFCYRVPEQYAVVLLCGNREVKELGRMPFGQYGVVNVLPSGVRSLRLDPLTGALESVRFEQETSSENNN